MIGDDLEGVPTVQVEGGEDGQEILRNEQEARRQKEVRKAADIVWLIRTGSFWLGQSLSKSIN